MRIIVPLALLLAAAPAPGASPLEPFDFLAGHCWRGEFDNGAADTHCFTWVYGGKHLRDVHVVRGDGPDYRGETIYSVDGSSGDVLFRYWNSLGGMSDGRIAFENGAILAPGERYVGKDGITREFRSTLRRLDADGYEAITEELIDGEWREFSRVEFARVGTATNRGSAARQQAERLGALERYIGEWLPAPDDPQLEQRPDMRGKVAMALSWGPRRMLLRVRETYPTGEPEQAVAEGLIYWDHVDSSFRFVMSSVYGWTFDGNYRVLDDGRLERVYDVRYPAGEEFIPEPDLGGQTRRFRETYRLLDPDRIEAALEIFRDDEWQAFGPGRYTLVRATE